jgi:hypothetical protein
LASRRKRRYQAAAAPKNTPLSGDVASADTNACSAVIRVGITVPGAWLGAGEGVTEAPGDADAGAGDPDVPGEAAGADGELAGDAPGLLDAAVLGEDAGLPLADALCEASGEGEADASP